MKRLGSFLLYLSLTIVAIFQIFPIVWLFLFSLKDNREIFSGDPFALPSEFRWENYTKVWEGGIGIYFWNSVWITVLAILFTVLFASMATFAITRMKWKLSKLVLGLCMVGMMIPIHSSIIPLFKMFLSVNLIDSPWSIVITYTAYNLPITIMILLGFYYTLPREIEEAAIIDGCSVPQMFFRIILPMTIPVMSTTVIINMIYNWNEFVFVNTFIFGASTVSFITMWLSLHAFNQISKKG